MPDPTVHNFHISQTDELFGAVIVDMFDAEPPCWIVEMNERKEKKIGTEKRSSAAYQQWPLCTDRNSERDINK